jgi:predicted glycosyl hydrolase (DUF1957 family)
MTTPDLNELLAKPLTRTRRSNWDATTLAARQKEQQRRSSLAQTRAKTALAHLHPEDYRALWDQAYAQVRAEAGPLPGDPPTNGDAA